ncbi:MAG: alcohol dehydrogenase [Pseudomonadota bacterium]|jgi:alcohol dehydrogenase class IV
MIWNYPTRVRFGVGEVQNLATEITRFGGTRPLLVTDPGVERAGLAAPIVQLLEQAGLPTLVFSEVSGNPTEANIEAGAAAYRAHNANCLVGLGGGSPLDSAKLIAVRVTVEHPFEQLDDALGGDRFIPDVLPPIVAVPTTAGTGSEVGRAGVITVKSTGRKTVIFAPSMLPRVAILDPELTRSMPPHITAATGIDALTHCLEALVAQGDHPMADAVALGGLELVWRSLARAVDHGQDLQARGDLLKAAMMGATAFQKGLGACHSLAHPLSSECGMHHGLANALCLTAVVEFNRESSAVAYDRVARIFGVSGARALAPALAEFMGKLGIRPGLSAAGVPRTLLPRLADLAFADACHTSNPRVCSRDDLLALYEAAM